MIPCTKQDMANLLFVRSRSFVSFGRSRSFGRLLGLLAFGTTLDFMPT